MSGKPLLIAAVWALAVSVRAATFVVSTDGADSDPGTYVRPLASLQKAVDLAQPGDSIFVRSGVYPVGAPVRIVNKFGTAREPIAITGEAAVVLRAAKDGVPGIWRGIVEIDSSSFVTVSRIAVENSGFFGFRVQYSRDITLSQDRSAISVGSGIYFRDSQRVKILHNDVSRFCDKNEMVQGVGCQEGVSLRNVDGFSIWGNLVHDAPQSPGVGPGGGEGIDAKEGTRNGVVAFNSVWNLVQLGIYVDGYRKGCSNIEVFGNRVWNVYIGIAISSEMGGLVRDIRVHDNVVHGVGVDGVNVTTFGRVPPGDGPREAIGIYNNTIIDAGVKEAKPPYYARWNPPGSYPDFGTGVMILTENVSGLKIANNIIVGSKTAAIQIKPAAAAKAVIESNLIWPASPSPYAKNPVNGERPLLAQPGFVDPDLWNWHLRSDSPAIGIGVKGLASTSDADGAARSLDKVDLGALAFHF